MLLNDTGPDANKNGMNAQHKEQNAMCKAYLAMIIKMFLGSLFRKLLSFSPSFICCEANLQVIKQLMEILEELRDLHGSSKIGMFFDLGAKIVLITPCVIAVILLLVVIFSMSIYEDEELETEGLMVVFMMVVSGMWNMIEFMGTINKILKNVPLILIEIRQESGWGLGFGAYCTVFGMLGFYLIDKMAPPFAVNRPLDLDEQIEDANMDASNTLQLDIDTAQLMAAKYILADNSDSEHNLSFDL